MMTDQENFNMQIQRQIDAQDARITNLIEVQNEKFNSFLQEMRQRDEQRAAELRDIRQEMRDRDNQRAAEIIAMRAETDAKLKEMQTTTDAKLAKMQETTDAKIEATNEKIAQLQASTDARIEKIESKLDSVGHYIMGMAITTIIGVGAMVATVVGFIYSVMSR